jgi:hypothetical protein
LKWSARAAAASAVGTTAAGVTIVDDRRGTSWRGVTIVAGTSRLGVRIVAAAATT